MANKDLDILLFVSSNSSEVDDKQILWLENFEYILKVCLKQVLKQEMLVERIFADETLKEASVYLQINLSSNFDNKSKLNSEDLVSVDGINIKEERKKKAVSFYNEKNESIDDLTSKISNISDVVWRKFSDLVYEIKKIVYRKKKNQNHIEKPTLFFAETSTDQEQNRLNLIREFRYRGYNTLPNENLSNDMMKFSDEVQACMDKAIISIHIIGNTYTPVLKNIDVSKVELQNDIFSEVNASTNSNLNRLVLIPPRIKIKSKKQKNYIESFKRNIELHKDTEIIQSPLEDFKSIIQKRIDLILNPNLISTSLNKAKGKFVYLIKDAEIENLDRFVDEIKKSGLEIVEIESEANKINMVKQHQFNLVNCEGVVVAFNSNNQQWLKSKLIDIIKSPGIGRTKPFNFKYLLTSKDLILNGLLEKNISKVLLGDKQALKQALDKIIES